MEKEHEVREYDTKGRLVSSQGWYSKREALDLKKRLQKERPRYSYKIKRIAFAEEN